MCLKKIKRELIMKEYDSIQIDLTIFTKSLCKLEIVIWQKASVKSYRKNHTRG